MERDDEEESMSSARHEDSYAAENEYDEADHSS